MRLTDTLALSHVPRWNIVPRMVEQTVADHSFRTTIIAVEIASRLGIPLGLPEIYWLLYHDASESRTGDIPAPAKGKLGIAKDSENRMFCDWAPSPLPESTKGAKIAAMADLVEGFTWIQRWGLGEHSRRASAGLYAAIVERCPPEWLETVQRVMDDITFDNER